MNKLFILIISFYASLTVLQAQTNVSGGIYQNATWTLASSPYIVNGPVVVFPGVTLNIQPGVEIRINNQTSSEIYIETRGTINCIGTDALPIKIHAMYDTMNTVAWQGFVCTSSQGGVLNADRFQIANAYFPFSYETPLANYNYTNCTFKRCFQAVTVGESVNLSNCQFIDNEVGVYGWANFTIDACLFKDNTTSIYAYASVLTMTNSDFIDNQIGLTFNANVFDSMYISECQFLNNGLALNYPNKGKVENCLFSDNMTAIQSAYKCEISNNEFLYNELAIQASVNADIHNNQINNNMGAVLIEYVTNLQDSPSIYNNEICGNINFAVNNNTNMNYSLLSNCFCDLDSAGIEAMIIDGYDDITKGLINYQIYDSSCTVLLGTVLKYGQGAGIDELAVELRFENPVYTELSLLGDAEFTTIQVTDLSGKSLVFKSTGFNHFDVSNLPAGCYVLSAVNDQLVRKSFVKM
ncbi:MAG: T9SS type A sorting domain-containing protein [Crocinitomicaceae bacterium]